jgi:hypothetical protein
LFEGDFVAKNQPMVVLSRLILATALSPSLLWAQETSEMSRPYFFSGPCTSQGMWTQQALNMTQRIREVTQQLRDDPNCKAAASGLQSMLGKVSESLGELESAAPGGTSSSLTSLPQEISALRTFMSEKSGPKQGILRTMMKKAVEYSTLTAQSLSSNAASMKSDSSTMTPPDPLMNVGQRFQAATFQGLKAFNSVVDSVALNSQCLTGPQQGQFLAAAASALANFARSGQDQIANELALGISKVSNLSRELRFSKVFKNLNKTEFMNSMSCLMEITSESYCSARDGYKLYEEMNNKIRTEQTDKIRRMREGLDPSKPMAGYYILTQQLPMISNWLQKIQIGVEPKLGTDAEFKNRVLNRVNLFYTSVNDVLGRFNEKSGYIQGDLKDPVAKKNNIIELVTILTNSLDGNMDAVSNTSEFYRQSVRSIDIPFRLIGLDKAPAIFFKENSTIEYFKWLQSDENWAKIPNSTNPDLLVETIGRNLRKIIEDTNQTVIIYYNRFFIFDKSALYLDAMLGTNYNVKDSLLSIDKYLAHLQQKIEDFHGDAGVAGVVIETRAKIGRILGKFRMVEALGEKMKLFPKTLSLSLVDEITSTHMSFINEVYTQFDVILGKSSWLANRMAKFVYYDYSLTLRNGVDLSPYFTDLYYATGFAAYDKMTQISAGGPTQVESDLHLALDTNQKNIKSLELLFRDNLVGMIREQRLISKRTQEAKDKCSSLKPKNFSSLSRSERAVVTAKLAGCVQKLRITPADVYNDMTKQSFYEGYDGPPGTTDVGVFKFLKGVGRSAWDLMLGPCITEGQCLGIRTDKYDLPGSTEALFNMNNESLPFDNEMRSSKYILARLCIQAMAFNDLKPFWHLCKETILESDFKAENTVKGHGDELDPDYYRILFAEKSYDHIEDPGLNQSQRVCAFRDFFRRNQVLYLTMGMQSAEANKKASTSGYTIEESPVDTAKKNSHVQPAQRSESENPKEDLPKKQAPAGRQISKDPKELAKGSKP